MTLNLKALSDMVKNNMFTMNWKQPQNCHKPHEPLLLLKHINADWNPQIQLFCSSLIYGGRQKRNNNWDKSTNVHITCSQLWTVPGICLAVILSCNNVLKQLSASDTVDRHKIRDFIFSDAHNTKGKIQVANNITTLPLSDCVDVGGHHHVNIFSIFMYVSFWSNWFFMSFLFI